MAKIQSIHKCVILLALIACHTLLTIEGRQPRSMYGDSAIPHKDVFRPTTAGKSPGAGHSVAQAEGDVESKLLCEGKKKILPPIGYGDSATAYKDDFQPTRAGNSPGIGHSFAQDEGDVESKVLSDGSVSTDGHSVTGFKDDFRPTAPGRSPGVGHKNAEPKA